MKETIKNVIYVLIDPITGQIRYVGQTVKMAKTRYREHISECNLKNDNSYKANWIKKLLGLNLKPEMYVIEQHETSNTLNEAEEFYIAYFRSIGCELTNSCDGGKGTFGYKHKEETKQIIGEKCKNRDNTHLNKFQIKKENIFIDNKEHRECFDCKKLVEIEFFNKKKDNSYLSYCRPCSNQRKRENRKINPDKLRYIKLSPEDYKQSRIDAAKKGGMVISNSPEKRAAISEKNSKPVIATSCSSSEILEFPSALKAKESGFHNKLIGDAIKSKRPYKGYYWKLKIKV